MNKNKSILQPNVLEARRSHLFKQQVWLLLFLITPKGTMNLECDYVLMPLPSNWLVIMKEEVLGSLDESGMR